MGGCTGEAGPEKRFRAVVALPPLRDFYRTVHRHSGLGALTVKAILLNNGWDTFFFNFPVQKKNGSPLPLPKELDYLKPYLIPGEKGPSSFFTQYFHFGPAFNDCAGEILSKEPDIIFLASFAYCYAQECIDLAKAIKSVSPSIPIAAGGAGVSAYPEYYLESGPVDYAFTGEVEETLPLFLSAFTPGKGFAGADSSIPGFFHRKNEQINFPREKYPPPPENPAGAWAITQKRAGTIYLSTSLSRGCPKLCRFCSVNLSQGRRFRTISFDFVKEMINAVKGMGKPVINFEDDNLLLSPEYLLKAAGKIKETFPDALFMAENGIDYTLLNLELLEKLLNLGLTQLNLSLGAISRPLLKQQKRESSLPLYEKLLAFLAARKIPVITYFICGLKDDTPEQIGKTLLYLSELPTLIGASLFYPVPGLPGFKDTALFTQTPPHLAASSSAYPWTGSLTTSQLITVFRLSRFINLLKKKEKTALQERLINAVFSSLSMYTINGNKGKEVLLEVPALDRELLVNVLGGLKELFQI